MLQFITGASSYPVGEITHGERALAIDCADQVEVDHLWEALGAGGTYSKCGWLKDRYGLSWQIVPSRLPQLMTGPDAAGRARTMQSMMQMSKLEIAVLEKAYKGA